MFIDGVRGGMFMYFLFVEDLGDYGGINDAGISWCVIITSLKCA